MAKFDENTVTVRYNIVNDTYEYSVSFYDNHRNYSENMKRLNPTGGNTVCIFNGMVIHSPTYSPSPIKSLFDGFDEYDGRTEFKGTMTCDELKKRQIHNHNEKKNARIRERIKTGAATYKEPHCTFKNVANGATHTLSAYLKKNYKTP
jgi:hypothetical protein